MLNLTNTLNVFIEATVMKTTEAAASVASNVATALQPSFTTQCYAERGYATVCCLSVCLSVMLRYVFHTGIRK